MTRDEKAAEMHRALMAAVPPCRVTFAPIPPAAAAPLASASVILTDTQSGAGTVGVKVFGDPA